MSKKTYAMLFCLLMSLGTMAQTLMREVFAELPDTILPLMTRNNRLDCIDFIDNNMEARVKNRFDEPIVLEALTADYLRVRTSESAVVEMKLVPCFQDTIICVCHTCFGPVADSNVLFYDLNWGYVRTMQRPQVSEFLCMPESADSLTEAMSDTLNMVRAEAEFLPLMRASLSPDTDEVVWTLQSREFSKLLKRVAARYLKPLVRTVCCQFQK